MSSSMSLRGRLVFGAVLWTLGLFAIVGIVLIQIMFRHPDAPRLLHAAFEQVVPMSAAAVVCLVAGFGVVRRGLAAIEQLRQRLTAVHQGLDRNVAGTYPAEVQPLVNDLNALLDHRERAVARAGDLAHGLKTPLAVLRQESERADAAGHHELAASVGQQVERMRRHIQYYLAHARAAASGSMPGARSSVAESADGLARTLRRLHAGRDLAIDVRVPQRYAVRTQREDLDEMLGNLMDNACKWARSTVVVDATTVDDNAVITIDDDGGGLEAGMRQAVLCRGVRADEAAPGSGLGLAIVGELAEAYGGAVELGDGSLGGLRATLRLPSAQ